MSDRQDLESALTPDQHVGNAGRSARGLNSDWLLGASPSTLVDLKALYWSHSLSSFLTRPIG